MEKAKKEQKQLKLLMRKLFSLLWHGIYLKSYFHLFFNLMLYIYIFFFFLTFFNVSTVLFTVHWLLFATFYCHVISLSNFIFYLFSLLLPRTILATLNYFFFSLLSPFYVLSYFSFWHLNLPIYLYIYLSIYLTIYLSILVSRTRSSRVT